MNILTNNEQVSLEGYKHNGERIQSPGKFEGEPIFAPYFWDMAMEGLADRDDQGVYIFKLAFNGQDRNIVFREQLKSWLRRKRTLHLRQDDQGFVHCY